MDLCDICLDPPRPLEGRITGAVRLDAVEGNRRLLAELPLREPVRLHFVEVAVRERLWEAAERTVRVVTVYNRSSLPLSEVEVAGGGAVPGSVRLNGLPEPEADPAAGVVLPGLGAGCAAALTWEVEDGGEREPVRVRYQYLFAGETLTGEAAPA